MESLHRYSVPFEPKAFDLLPVKSVSSVNKNCGNVWLQTVDNCYYDAKCVDLNYPHFPRSQGEKNVVWIEDPKPTEKRSSLAKAWFGPKPHLYLGAQ